MPIKSPMLSSSAPTPSQIPSAARLLEPELADPSLPSASFDASSENPPPLPLLSALEVFPLPGATP
jgi:hypothetical protein